MYESSMKGELAQKYEELELMRMWSQLWTLARVMAVVGILSITHTMPLFALVAGSVALLAIYKLNKI